jgi:endonuclease/exonuclease/phosphatase family metal-dependent hydrolase
MGAAADFLLKRGRARMYCDPVRTAAALFDGPAGPILVYGTVLPWHADRGAHGRARNWTEHHRVIPEQAAEWAELAARYPTATLCVAGDYNTDLADSHVYGTAQGRALLESGLAAAALRCTTRTVEALADPPIDHVSVSGAGRTRVVAAWEGTVAGEQLSDHSAVVVEVSGSAPAALMAPDGRFP